MTAAAQAATVSEASAGIFAASTSPGDAINRRILEVSEDRVQGFVRDPMRTIAELSGLPMPVRGALVVSATTTRRR